MSKQAPWMQTAFSLLGTKETSGTKNNPVIMKWAKLAGLQKTYTADSIPWCGLFVAFCMVENGIVPVKDPLWALNWNKFGDKLSEPLEGCIITFKRTGGGHVGFCVGQDATTYHVIGGNQSDNVTITRIEKSRCQGWRWPKDFDKFKPTTKLKTQTLAGTISKNEA